MAGENETLGGFGFEEDPIETSDAQDPPAINDREEVGGFTFQQDEIERETGVAADELRTQIDGAQIIEDFDPREIEALKGFFEQYAPDINSIFFDIESSIASATEMSEAELITELGNTTISGELGEFGSNLQSEVSRIHGLTEGELVSVPGESVEYIFETKKEALLYLYMQKISAYKIQEFINSLPENERNMLMPGIIGILVAWVGFSLAGSTRRGVGKLLYKFNIGQRITAVEQPNAEGQDAARLTGEFTEYSQRRQAIDLARIVFQGNDDISQSLSKPAFELFIDARIQDVRGGAPVEQSFWRNMHNIINQRGRLAQAGDIIIKPYYFDKRSDIIGDLENAARIRTETIDFFTNGNGKTEIESIRAFMELDHDVLNETELRTRDRFDVVRTDLLGGNLHFLFGMNLDQAKVEVRRRIAAPILEGRTNPPSIDSIVGNGSHANPGEGGRLVKNEVTNFAFITDITQYEQTLTSRMLDARLNGEEYNSNAVRGQLQSFFASIGREGGQNRYTYYSALSIIEKILEGNTKAEAITIAESESGNDLRGRITDTDYLVNQNADITRKVGNNIVARAQAISNAEELRKFQDNILDELRDQNDRFWPGFQSAGRSIDRVVADKIRELEVDGKITSAIPEPLNTNTPGSPETIEESNFRAQPIFDDSGNMTPNATLLFDANIRLHNLDSNEPINIERIIDAVEGYNKNLNTIGEMLDDLKELNGINVIESLEDAREIIVQSRFISIKDITERAIIKAGLHKDYNITAHIDGNGTIGYDLTIPGNSTLEVRGLNNYDELETHLIQNLGIDSIPDWDEIVNSDPVLLTTRIRFESQSWLRSIDDFFRRAR